MNDKGELQGEMVTPVLFQEQDGVVIYIKGEDRPKGKSKKKELKVAVSYTVWAKRPGNDKEHIVIDKTVC